MGAVKRLSLVFTLAVFVALAIGILTRHRSTAELPSFPRAPSVRIDPLPVPGGSESLILRIFGPAEVALEDVAVRFRAGEAPYWGFTDAGGRVRFSGLPPGPVEVVVLSFRRPILRATLSLSEREQVLTLGDLTPAPERLPDIERSPLTGTILGTSEASREGYAVVLLPTEPPQTFSGAVPRRVLTDQDGKFAIEDLALGTYRFVVLPPWALGGTWPDLAPESSAQFVHRSDSSAAMIELRLGTITGVVLDDVDRPLEDALVIAVEDGHPNRVWTPLVSDSKGRFFIRDMPPGVYRLRVSAGEGEVTALVRVQPGVTVEVKLPPLRPRDRGAGQ
jgi:hypothetical protein